MKMEGYLEDMDFFITKTEHYLRDAKQEALRAAESVDTMNPGNIPEHMQDAFKFLKKRLARLKILKAHIKSLHPLHKLFLKDS